MKKVTSPVICCGHLTTDNPDFYLQNISVCVHYIIFACALKLYFIKKQMYVSYKKFFLGKMFNVHNGRNKKATWTKCFLQKQFP